MGSLKDLTPEEFSNKFPNLQSQYHETSIPAKYNCVAWVINERIWTDAYTYNWPDDLERGDSPQHYAEFFKCKGFEICNNCDLESNIEKIAIFVDKLGNFTHVAIQLENNHWSSKLGDWEDIEHYTLKSLSGGDYGNVVIFMKRKKKN